MKKRILRTALALVATTCGLLSAWSWASSSPVGSSPDEGFHLVSMWCGPDKLVVDCKEDVNNPPNYLVPGLMGEPWLCFYGRPEQSAGCQAEDTAGRRISTAGFNTTQYPPYYYDVARELVSEDIIASVLTIRRANALFSVLLVAAAIALHRRKSWYLATLVLAASIPLATFFVPSVNPTGLAISGVSAFTLAASSLLQRNQQWRELILPALILLISALVSFGSRRDAIAYCALLGVATLVIDGYSRFERGLPLPTFIANFLRRPAVVGIGVATVLLGAIFIISGFGSVVTTGLDGDVENRDFFTVLLTNLLELPAFFAGFFSGPGWGLGWLDTPMPLIVPIGAAITTTALFKPSLKNSMTPEKVVFSALIAVIALLALIALQADLRFVGESVQPRYLYPLLLGAILLIAARSDSRPTRSILFLSASAIIVSHSVALRTNIRRYTTGLDVRSWRLDEPLEWWWSTGPSATITWLVGSLSFGLATAICVTFARLRDGSSREVSAPGA